MKATKLTKETIRELGIVERKFPDFEEGDAIKVSEWIVEGVKRRLQVFEGDVIAFHHNGASTTFMVRRIASDSVAVEKIYPYYSPIIETIEVLHKGDVRRAKLYYMRDRIGKAARVKEKVLSKEAKAHKREVAARHAAAQAAAKQVADAEVTSAE